MTLEEHLSGIVAEVGAEARAMAGGGTEFRRDGRAFAFATGNVVEVKLDPEIAEAALHTPSTSASSRGADWVRLAPDEATQMDLDRARAWFLSAWRAAER
jgi:hypothetical protein